MIYSWLLRCFLLWVRRNILAKLASIYHVFSWAGFPHRGSEVQRTANVNGFATEIAENGNGAKAVNGNDKRPGQRRDHRGRRTSTSTATARSTAKGEDRLLPVTAVRRSLCSRRMPLAVAVNIFPVVAVVVLCDLCGKAVDVRRSLSLCAENKTAGLGYFFLGFFFLRG